MSQSDGGVSPGTGNGTRFFPIADREIAIANYLRKVPLDEGRTIKEIHKAVTTELRDEASVQFYHKLIDRQVALGRVEQISDEQARGRMFRLSPALHVANPLTLDEINDWVAQSLPPSEIIARAMNATDYFTEHSATLRKAAEALLEEDPVEVFMGMVTYHLDALRKDLALHSHRHPDTGEPEASDPQLTHRILEQYHEVKALLYYSLSVPTDVVDITEVPQVQNGKRVAIQYSEADLREVLRRRVFGNTFLQPVDAPAGQANPKSLRMVVSGSDGSTHTGIPAVHAARGFSDQHELVITFNNSIAFVRESDATPLGSQARYPFYSVPMTRSALDNPENRGMVLAPLMFKSALTESEYIHMARCATDVVQWRVDAAVMGGIARALSADGMTSVRDGLLLPKPAVHFRDGTVTLQERAFSHYNRPRNDPYGDFVREGVGLARNILQQLVGGAGTVGRVFAGATKSTQMRLFGKAINWYIAVGSKTRFGEPIDARWDVSRLSHVSDNEVMTNLFRTLADPSDVAAGKYYVSCVVVRQFHSLTDLFAARLPAGDTEFERWLEFFEDRRRDRLREREEAGGEINYTDFVDFEDDPFVWMCATCDYGLFFIGHTGLNPPPLLPRYEFMDSLRSFDNVEKAKARVQMNVERICQALTLSGLALDQDHNYLSNRTIVKIIPQVVYTAHEHCKVLGKQLEAELRSWIVARLQASGKARGVSVADTDLRPMPIRDYLKRLKKADRDASPRLSGHPDNLDGTDDLKLIE